MDNKKIDLTDIKEPDVDKTASFTDIMTRSEKKKIIKEKDLNKTEPKKVNNWTCSSSISGCERHTAFSFPS